MWVCGIDLALKISVLALCAAFHDDVLRAKLHLQPTYQDSAMKPNKVQVDPGTAFGLSPE
jgi:hypothetical protein